MFAYFVVFGCLLGKLRRHIFLEGLSFFEASIRECNTASSTHFVHGTCEESLTTNEKTFSSFCNGPGFFPAPKFRYKYNYLDINNYIHIYFYIYVYIYVCIYLIECFLARSLLAKTPDHLE